MLVGSATKRLSVKSNVGGQRSDHRGLRRQVRLPGGQGR